MELFATRFEGSQKQNIFQKQNETLPSRDCYIIELHEKQAHTPLPHQPHFILNVLRIFVLIINFLFKY